MTARPGAGSNTRAHRRRLEALRPIAPLGDEGRPLTVDLRLTDTERPEQIVRWVALGLEGVHTGGLGNGMPSSRIPGPAYGDSRTPRLGAGSRAAEGQRAPLAAAALASLGAAQGEAVEA